MGRYAESAGRDEGAGLVYSIVIIYCMRSLLDAIIIRIQIELLYMLHDGQNPIYPKLL